MLELLRSFTRPRRSSRRQRAAVMFGEALECRTMLAGNVEAILADGDLSLDGDSSANSVEVTVEGEDLVVRGLDGTTINGSSDDFVLEAGSTTFAGSIDLRLGAGADTFRLTGPLTIGGSIDSSDSRGAGEFAITDATVEGGVDISSGGSKDTVSFVNAAIDGELTLNLRHGRNFISLLDSSVLGKMDVRTGNQNDVILLEGTTVGGLCAVTGRRTDDIILENSTIDGDFYASTGGDRDYVLIEESSVTGDTEVRMWWDSDLFVTQGEVDFGGDLRVGGILGRKDTMELSDETTIGGETRFLRFERRQIDDLTSINNRIDRRQMKAAEIRALLNNGDLGELTLTVDTSDNEDVVESNNTLITNNDTFLITGTTLPGATVDVTAGEGGAIDLGSVVAGADGTYSIEVDLLDGGTTVMVTATDVIDRTITEEFNVHKAVGTVVRVETTEGSFDLELYDDDAPNTVANFLDYLDRYADSIIHRSALTDDPVPEPFVIQGGGVVLDANDVAQNIVKDPPIDSEFTGAHSNLRGTIAMAMLSGDPDSATSEWFVNMTDENTFLDGLQFTVFGEVIGGGMDVLDDIATIDRVDLQDILTQIENVSLDEVPLNGYTPDQIPLTGTVSIPAGSNVVTGDGTLFTTELMENDVIQIDGQSFRVIDIATDTEMSLDVSPSGEITDASYSITRQPTREEYVLINSIDVLFDGDDADPGELTLTVDTSDNEDVVESNNTLVTNSDTFLITGTTLPGATVDVAAGEGGAIDLGSVVAGADGTYSIEVDLFNGGTTVMVTATDVINRTITEEFNLHKAVGTVVRVETTEGSFDLELYDDDAPNTVDNFLNYLDRYVDSIIHRSALTDDPVPEPFVIQGGGVVLDGNDVAQNIVKDLAIDSEFTGANSNVRGTIAMATLGGDPDSATSEWFINMTDENTFLDGQQFTVFGEVIGDGMDVLDDIATIDRVDLEDILTQIENVLLDEVPLNGYTPDQILLTGTVSIPAGSNVVTGDGTLFTTELMENDVIEIEGEPFRVIDITNDTELTLDASPVDQVTDAAYSITRQPTREEYVLIDSISVIL